VCLGRVQEEEEDATADERADAVDPFAIGGKKGFKIFVR
jgi:hypothetical protein